MVSSVLVDSSEPVFFTGSFGVVVGLQQVVRQVGFDDAGPLPHRSVARVVVGHPVQVQTLAEVVPALHGLGPGLACCVEGVLHGDCLALHRDPHGRRW